MRSFYHIAYVCSLVFAAVFALPSTPASTLHILEKRADVCGLDFRKLVTKQSCLARKNGYFLKGTSAVELKPVTKLPGPELQCDHIVELQLLGYVFLNGGVCKIATAMDAAGVKKSTFLNGAAQTISGIKNLYYLATKVNGQKKTVISNSFRGKSPPKKPSDLDKAVADYLVKTESDSSGVAASLDDTVKSMVKDAEAKRDSLPTGDKKRQALDAAIKEYTKSGIKVKVVWAKVLKDARTILAS